MMDFDPGVTGVAAQPFALALTEGDFGKTTKLHIPDYLVRYARVASKLMRDGETPIAEVCGAVGVSRAALCRYLEPGGTPRKRANRGPSASGRATP